MPDGGKLFFCRLITPQEIRMGYQLTELLLKCDEADYDLLVKQIDSYVNFSSDRELRELLDLYVKEKTDGRKIAFK